MEKKLKKTKLKAAEKEPESASTPSMSFRFGKETMEKLGALSVHLEKSMAATVKELIQAQYIAQFKDDERAAKVALAKWKSSRDAKSKKSEA